MPAYTAGELLRRDVPDAAAALKSIDYPPVAAVTLTYPESALRPERIDQQGQFAGAGMLGWGAAARWCHYMRWLHDMASKRAFHSRSVEVHRAVHVSVPQPGDMAVCRGFKVVEGSMSNAINAVQPAQSLSPLPLNLLKLDRPWY